LSIHCVLLSQQLCLYTDLQALNFLVGVNIGGPTKWMKEIKCTGGMFFHSVFV